MKAIKLHESIRSLSEEQLVRLTKSLREHPTTEESYFVSNVGGEPLFTIWHAEFLVAAALRVGWQPILAKEIGVDFDSETMTEIRGMFREFRGAIRELAEHRWEGEEFDGQS